MSFARLSGVRVVEERLRLVGGRDDAGDVEVGAAEELLVGADRRGLNLRVREFAWSISRVDQFASAAASLLVGMAGA